MHDAVSAIAGKRLERANEALESWIQDLRAGNRSALDLIDQLRHEAAYWRDIVEGTRTPSLWLSDAGQVACELHLGHYAQTELHRRPFARDLATALERWHRLEPYDLEEFDRLSTNVECGTCHNGRPPAQ